MQEIVNLKNFKKKKEASQYLKNILKFLSECDQSVFSHDSEEIK